MYDRAPRILTRAATNTAPEIGPGAYYNPSLNKKPNSNWSYAPFQSLGVRESFLTIDEGTAAAPGPAHYSPSTTHSSIKGGSSVSNKAIRFSTSHLNTPGPGSYTVLSKWNSAQSNSVHVKDKVSRIKFKRQGNPPSIPSTGFNNGYEEDSSGTLKPQEIPASDCTLGPAYYNVPHSSHMESSVEKYKGVSFGNLSSDRTVFKECEGPGPCKYSPDGLSKEGQSYGRTFMPTNIPRYHELVAKEQQHKDVPGPGRYNLKSQFNEESSREDTCLEVEKPPFGSRLQRFLTEKQHSPASTTYQDPRTALTSIYKLHGLKQTPFSQSSQRFKSNRLTAESPGPGSYNDNYVTGMATQLMRRAMLDGSNKIPFGSTSVRTVPLTKRDVFHMPGPADYQDGKVQSPRYYSKDKLSHTFASSSKRLYSPNTDNPPPNSYEVSKAYLNTQGKIDASFVKTGFLSTSERFAPPRDILIEEPDIFNPGPGEYQIEEHVKQPGGVISSEKPRFKAPKATTPGPGTYKLSRSQRDTLLQGTYNAKLLNPLTEDQSTNSPPREKKTVLVGV